MKKVTRQDINPTKIGCITYKKLLYGEDMIETRSNVQMILFFRILLNWGKIFYLICTNKFLFNIFYQCQRISMNFKFDQRIKVIDS